MTEAQLKKYIFWLGLGYDETTALQLATETPEGGVEVVIEVPEIPEETIPVETPEESGGETAPATFPEE